MALFTGLKTKGQLLYDDPVHRDRYIKRYLKDGERFRENLKRAAPAKTSPQLGYYYGLLRPEIHQQYLRNGMTATVRMHRLIVERPLTEDDSHAIIKDVCGLVGDDGKRMDVGDMDEWQMSKFIDNCLFHAVNDLGMNGEKLEAKRPALPDKELRK
ncbi:MAG: hypothetical protein ACYSSI_00275 [Planctomycetota bacterium]|jgi:hypothetical protein